MGKMSEISIDASCVQDFQRDGVAVIRGGFRSWVDPLRDAIDALMKKPSSYERSYQPEDGSALFFQDLCNWQRFDGFKAFVLSSGAANLARELMGAKKVQFFHDHVLVKEPGSSIPTPWHQDAPYYCASADQTVSFWMVLDHVEQDQSLRLVAGSHLLGETHKPQRFDGTDLYVGDTREKIPDIDAQIERYDIRSYALEPGDLVAFDFRTIHAAPGNHKFNTRRRAFSTRWLGDNAHFVDQGGKGSPPLEHLQLVTGDPLPYDEFPIF